LSDEIEKRKDKIPKRGKEHLLNQLTWREEFLLVKPNRKEELTNKRKKGHGNKCFAP